MKHPLSLLLPSLIGLLAIQTPAWADKPAWAGKGGKEAHYEERHGGGGREDRDDGRQRDAGSYRFSDGSRRIISDYYGDRARSGHCPPGLAKKNNGCLPPGQAKKWAVGHALPGDIRYYPLPLELIARLPALPSTYRYVQIAGDILMIAAGTNMVIDAVEDILR